MRKFENYTLLKMKKNLIKRNLIYLRGILQQFFIIFLLKLSPIIFLNYQSQSETHTHDKI